MQPGRGKTPNRIGIAVGLLAAACLLAPARAGAWTPLAVEDDPLVRMPGTQPGDGVSVENPNRCLNCHEGYDLAVEPGHNWKGSMMAQAARDFVYWSCLAVAAQDSIWAVGRPNATDICLRCHMMQGWIEGRSDPTNGSLMTGADFDGVHCDFCHQLYDPFFEDTYAGTREGSDWVGYWDETNASGTPSQSAADTTLGDDRALASLLTLFNGNALFGPDHRPVSPSYDENAAGQYFVSSGGEKRASFADASARHPMRYSRYHKSRYFCGICHDVANPVLANLAFEGTPPGDGTTVLTTEQDPAYSYTHVERTFSEFMLSDYGLQGGAAGSGPFAPEVFETSLANNHIARCQDCHMGDGSGKGADKNDAIDRRTERDPEPTESIEHPLSGQPVHDLTGGNVFVPTVLASTVPSSPNYDAVNQSLLGQGPGVLTLDLGAGQGLDPAALLAGAERARQNLRDAASIERIRYRRSDGALSFRIVNHTGHKLISGFPEGRRMFVNVKAYAEDALIHEVNPYDAQAGTLKGLSGYSYADPYPEFEGALPAPAPLGPAEVHDDALVYEVHPSSTLTGETKTFHFALATGREKDNRIPPKGFRIAEAAARISEPVWEGEPALDYFTPEEYAGGYDQISLQIAPGADRLEIRLYYQTTSREYMEFLRDEIDGTGNTLPGNGSGGDPAYLIQTDPFFSQLKAWGGTIWKLWKHNLEVDGAAPYQMVLAEKDLRPFLEVPALGGLGSALLIAVLVGSALGALPRRRTPRG